MMIMRPQISSVGKTADKPAAISNKAVLDVYAAALHHRQPPQRLCDSVRAEDRMR